GRSDEGLLEPVDRRRRSGCPAMRNPRYETLAADPDAAATWFFPALLAAYSASSAARNRSSAVVASSSGRLATPKLAVMTLPCGMGYFRWTFGRRSVYSLAPASDVSPRSPATSSPP